MERSCPLCLKPLRAEARFCPHCGARLDARLAPGTPLLGGDYVIERPLSSGGMGSVYLARDHRAFDRVVVVKQMLDYYDAADPAEQAAAQQRFEEEGRTLAYLRHPGVPEIYTFFVEHGRFYIVMEHIQGETLEAFVSHEDGEGRQVPRKLLAVEDALRYTIQACGILEYLHSRSRPVVHGDVKPANLIVETQLGYVRLVDFGTASVRRDGEHHEGAADKQEAYGTDGYAAPEQYRGRAVAQSDVFGLAATAYHLLTDDDPRGHPFQWPNLSRLPREVSLALERCLRTEPGDRPSAAELRQALEAIATPKRALQTFTFPGGAQIRSVTSLPALSDEHWDAARSFLYKGDFQRWLRDLNRLDLVVAADDIVAAQKNADAGLEAFLRSVDPGLVRPKVASDPAKVDLGSVAREAALIRTVTLRNATRGYVQVEMASSQPWLEVKPARANLWAGVPVDVHVHVHAEGLPFRAEQKAEVTVRAEGLDPLVVPVTARVSLLREGWRIFRRMLAGALPGAWRTVFAWVRALVRLGRRISRPLARHEWLFWLIWLLASAGVFYLLRAFPRALQIALATLGTALPPEPLAATLVQAFLALLGPPSLAVAVSLAALVVAIATGIVVGGVRGAWRSFFR